MNWEAAGAIGEIVGAAAVVASLVFLAFETRSSARIQKASLSNASLAATAAVQDLLMTDAELRGVVNRSFAADAKPDDFDAEAWGLLVYFERAVFMRLEGTYWLYRRGLIEESLWLSRVSVAAGLVRLPVWRKAWQAEREGAIYTAEFMDAVDRHAAGDYRHPS